MLPCSQEPATAPLRASWIQSTMSHPVYFNIILPFASVSLNFPDKSLLCMSHLFSKFYMSRSSHPPWFDHRNNIQWKAQIMNLRIQFSSASCYIPLRSRYSPQHHLSKIPSIYVLFLWWETKSHTHVLEWLGKITGPISIAEWSCKFWSMLEGCLIVLLLVDSIDVSALTIWVPPSVYHH